MATWTNYAALIASLASGKAFTDEKAQALAENTLAGLECDVTAPVNAACWHPYDMVFGNDGAIGRFWNYSALTDTVSSPTMEAGWNYMFRGINLSHNNTVSAKFLTIAGAQSVQISHGASLNFWFTIISPAITNFPKQPAQFVYNITSNVDLSPVPTLFTNNNTALTGFDFTWSGSGGAPQAFDAGQLFMYRQRNYMP